MNMLDILFVVIGSSFFLWMFYESIRTQQPFINKQQGKPDQPIEYNLKIINVSSFEKFLKHEKNHDNTLHHGMIPDIKWFINLLFLGINIVEGSEKFKKVYVPVKFL